MQLKKLILLKVRDGPFICQLRNKRVSEVTDKSRFKHSESEREVGRGEVEGIAAGSCKYLIKVQMIGSQKIGEGRLCFESASVKKEKKKKTGP